MFGVCALVACATCAVAEFSPVREVEVDGRRILIDNTNTRLSIEVVDEFGDQPREVELARGLYRDYAAAAEAADYIGAQVLPSVSLVYAKGKRFDDGMYAAVELTLEDSFGALAMGKPEFLRAILGRLEDRHASYQGFARQACAQAMSCVASALVVGGRFDAGGLPSDAIINERAGRKPLGFFTWNDELSGIFRRDTALQVRCDPVAPRAVGGVVTICDIVTSDPELLATYDRLRVIYARLTNRMVGLTARDVMREVEAVGGIDAVLASEDAALQLGKRFVLLRRPGFALLEPSMSKEMFLLWEAGASGLSSMDEMIRAIRDGRIDLAPDDTSGWYEYQQYALEPLLLPDKMPEGRKLKLGAKYRKLLEEHLKSMLANIRETHAKQLELVEGEATGPVAMTIEPHLAVEPIGATYLRFAKAYGFLRTVLSDDIGPETLSLHVLDEGAELRPGPLGGELDGMQELMRGAYLLTCRDIGLTPDATAAANLPDMTSAEKWLDGWRDDPDMRRDVRMMIPVARMPDVYWAVIGVKLVKLNVAFEQRPTVRAVEPGVEVRPHFTDAEYWVPVEQFVEVQVDGEPLDREEFRALCDKNPTEEAIRAALPKAIANARVAEPKRSLRDVPVPRFAPPWYTSRPWMIWVAAGALIAIISLVAVFRSFRNPAA